MADTLPAPHSDPSLEVLRPYIAQTVRCLEAFSVQVERSWLDPVRPRDATIVCQINGERHAVVFDEETGWRYGHFENGWPGVRTLLVGAVHMGGGLLPSPDEVATRFVSGVSEPACKYRIYSDETERFDGQVRTLYGATVEQRGAAKPRP